MDGSQVQTRVAVVVDGLQNGVQVLGRAGLLEDAHAGQAALLAGKVQRSVSSKVPQLRITASFQQCLSNFWLASDDSQVERRLRVGERAQISLGAKSSSECP